MSSGSCSIATCLMPSLRPGDLVIMDNLSSHKTADVVRLIESVGAFPAGL